MMHPDVPKIRKIPAIVGVAFQGLGIAASIFGFIKLDQMLPETYAGMVYALFFVVVTFSLAAYILRIRLKKLHRYADIPPFTHFVNHTIRNVLTRTRRKVEDGTFGEDDLEEMQIATVAMLDAIARCFSILTGSHCSVCIKELQHGATPRVRVAYRDSISLATRGADDGEHDPHEIDRDTPCEMAFKAGAGFGRGYICNNVKREWLRGRYKTESFIRYGGREPSCVPFLGIPFVRNWKIHYNCTMVSPIRYRAFPVTSGKLLKSSGNKGPSGVRCWGFLCVDAKRRNLFVEARHRDVLATFSDGLFVYFNELHDIIDRYTDPGNS